MTFEEYARARGPALVRLARLLVRDRHVAEDLVQEVLATAYRRWDRIAREGRPDVYVRRMLVNARASWWRRRSTHEVPSDTQVEGAVGDPASPVAERDALWRLVVELPVKQRAVVVLRYYEDLDDVAIAEILDCSPVTVRTHAMRALSALRQRVGGQEVTTMLRSTS